MDKNSHKAYEEMASIYEENQKKDMAYNIYYERPGIIDLLSDLSDKNVLDVGCAAGFFSKWALDHGASVTAIDYSETMVEKTKEVTKLKATVFKGDISEPMPFIANQSFDVIIASLVLHYVEDMSSALKELGTKLKKGGEIVISVHHPFMDFTTFDCDDYFKTELIHDEWIKSGKKIQVQFYRRPLSDIMNALCENGFMIESVSEPMPHEGLKAINEKAYKRLSTNPHFLFVKAKKM